MFWAILFMFQTICDSSYCYFDHSFKQIIGLVIIRLLSAALRIVLTKVLNYYFPNFKTNRSNDFWLILIWGDTRELKMETFSGRQRPNWQRKPGTEAAVAPRQKSNIKIAVNSEGRGL